MYPLIKQGINHLLFLIGKAEGEEGQTSAEYVAVTAVAVTIALTVIYVALSTALTDAVGDIGSAITTFVSDNLPGGEEPEE